jgi:MerR family transcriptional regulator, aldehyde-responsive regulator
VQISDVSEKCDISPDTLRYYERVGLLPPVRRSKSGLRDYSESDLMWIDFIKCMRSAGLPIEQLARYVQLFPQGEATAEARKQILQDQREQIRARMAELQRTLDLLDHKIASYEKSVVPAERELLRTKDSAQGNRVKPERPCDSL